MVALRSRRLETLLGATISSVTHSQVVALAQGRVAEDYDLDFKSELYGTSDSAKRSLAVDVAAMANTAGGLIILGMDEDDQGHASTPTYVEVTDAEINRMHQVLAVQVAPLPRLDVRAVQNTDRPGTGFILIAVPRSPLGPHAVVVNDSLRYPRRHGRTTTYLSESDVAQAYRDRFTGLQSRFDVAVQHEKYLVDRMNTSTSVYAVVTLVPDLDGHVEIDRAGFEAFQLETAGRTPLLVHGDSWGRASVGPDRFIADIGYRDPDDAGDVLFHALACALHKTGAGSIAIEVSRREQPGDDAEIDDEWLVVTIASGIRFLAGHARDRAAAAGTASLRATVVPISTQSRAVLTHRRPYGRSQRLGSQRVGDLAAATVLADVGDLVDDGASLLSATHGLCAGLMQGFGFPEPLQVTSAGELRRDYWSRYSVGDPDEFAARNRLTFEP
ncbi:ATP-binding protein [Actinosynnema sp. NPDC023794]